MNWRLTRNLKMGRKKSGLPRKCKECQRFVAKKSEYCAKHIKDSLTQGVLSFTEANLQVSYKFEKKYISFKIK